MRRLLVAALGLAGVVALTADAAPRAARGRSVGMSAATSAGTAPRSPAALGLGRLLVVVSGLGFPITQAAIARFGRRGAIVAEGVAVGLLVRDAALVATGTPRQLRRWPATLLWLELIAAAAATVAGLAAVVRPGQVVDRTLAGRAEALRRFTVGLLFGLHTYRFQIYLRSDRGLPRALEADSTGLPIAPARRTPGRSSRRMPDVTRNR